MAMASGIDIRFHSAEYRQCTVDGKRALFHRWVEKEQLLIKFKSHIREEEKIKKFRDTYIKDGVLPFGIGHEKLKTLVALVEFEDGTMAEVDPLSVWFMDSQDKFDELYWKENEV